MTATAEGTIYSATQLSEYIGKRVKFTQNLKEQNEKGEGAVEVEGTVQAVNDAMGLLLKPKGSVNFSMFDLGDIEPGSVSLAQDSSTKLKASKLKVLKVGQARRHLLERHGLTLSQVNGMTEEQALEYHSSIDHETAELGHVHVEKDEKSKDSEDSNDSE